MGHDISYVFFDLAALAPLWGRRLSEVSASLPRSQRSRLREAVEFALPAEEEGQANAVIARETVRSLLRRADDQLHVLIGIASLLSEFDEAICGADSPYLSEPSVLIATAVGAVLRGDLSREHLRAVCKIHSVAAPGRWLGLPRKDRRRLGVKPIEAAELFKPWYAWQGPDACGYGATGWGEYDLGNCLSPGDTRRFIEFFDQAWDWNLPVPYFREKPLRTAVGFDTVSVPPLKDGDRYFREFSLCQELVKPIESARRFKRPGLVFDKT